MHLIDKIFRLLRMMMGIGTGAFPNQSGEEHALVLLRDTIFTTKHEQLVVFDVGANKGQFLEVLLNVFHKNRVHIYSFEPVKSSFLNLKKRYEKNKNVTLENIGFDDHPNKSKIYYDEPGSLYASKYNRDVSRLNVSFEQYEIASFQTIDQYCEIKNIRIIHCLKIDVEGNELNVLKGAHRLFKNKAITSVLFEFGPAQIDSRTFFKDFYTYLNSVNLANIYRILPSGKLLSIESYDEKLEMFFTTNYLAISETMNIDHMILKTG